MAVASHQSNLSSLINRSLQALPASGVGDTTAKTISIGRDHEAQISKQKPDLVAVTRGPGITSALSTGLQAAKGLAVAWQVPFVGVNHMQAHAVTPRLAHALSDSGADSIAPKFPYLSMLVSGGHTLLVHSTSLCEHAILASTKDIAIGDAIDKMARCIVPEEELRDNDVMYGPALERFAFSEGYSLGDYVPPQTRVEEVSPRPTRWGWALPKPLAETRDMGFSFTGLGCAVKRVCDAMDEETTRSERVELARECMKIAFEHLALRVVWALQGLQKESMTLSTLVVSGGVASNTYLRFM